MVIDGSLFVGKRQPVVVAQLLLLAPDRKRPARFLGKAFQPLHLITLL
jgi:hypothetical protein